MKLIRRRLSLLIVVVVSAISALVSFAGNSPARAATLNFCILGTSSCLNDWSNTGIVRLFPGGASNENFYEVQLTGRCNNGYVTATCPFANTAYDRQYIGSIIVQLDYGSTGFCVATGGTGGPDGIDALLAVCNNPGTGKGGGTGSIFIDHGGYMINLYWSNNNSSGHPACMQGLNGTGANSDVDLNYPTNDGCDQWFTP